MATMDPATEAMLLARLLAGDAGQTAQVASGDAQQQEPDRAMVQEDFAAIPGLLSGSHSTLHAVANIWQAMVAANQERTESGAEQPACGRRGVVPLPGALGTDPFLRAVAAGYHAKGQAPRRSLPPRDRPLAPLAPYVTTLTVRKIPAPYTQEELLAEWPAAGSFDYLHFPYSEGLGRSVSIAFINFLTPELAACFYERWHGRRLARHPSARSLVVEASRVQGRNANLALVHADARVLPVVSFGDEYLGGQRLLRMVELAKAGACPVRV